MANFGIALEAMKFGQYASRKGWPVPSPVICLRRGVYDFKKATRAPGRSFTDGLRGLCPSLLDPLDNANTVLPYFISMAGSVSVHGWLPTLVDLMADDWVVFSSPNAWNGGRPAEAGS
jgi:hypothetical protein